MKKATRPTNVPNVPAEEADVVEDEAVAEDASKAVVEAAEVVVEVASKAAVIIAASQGTRQLSAGRKKKTQLRGRTTIHLLMAVEKRLMPTSKAEAVSNIF